MDKIKVQTFNLREKRKWIITLSIISSYNLAFIFLDLFSSQIRFTGEDLDIYLINAMVYGFDSYFWRNELLPIPIISSFAHYSWFIYQIIENKFWYFFAIRFVNTTIQISVFTFFLNKKYHSDSIMILGIFLSPIIFVLNFHLLRQSFAISLLLVSIVLDDVSKKSNFKIVLKVIACVFLLIAILSHSTIFLYIISLVILKAFHEFINEVNRSWLYVSIILLISIYYFSIRFIVNNIQFLESYLTDPLVWFFNSFISSTIFLIAFTLVTIFCLFSSIRSNLSTSMIMRSLILPLAILPLGWVYSLILTIPTLSSILFSDTEEKFSFTLITTIVCYLLLPFQDLFYRFLPLLVLSTAVDYVRFDIPKHENYLKYTNFAHLTLNLTFLSLIILL